MWSRCNERGGSVWLRLQRREWFYPPWRNETGWMQFCFLSGTTDKLQTPQLQLSLNLIGTITAGGANGTK